MAKLTVRLRGEIVANLSLENGAEYIAGRAQDAQIRLENERGISRQHLKFYQRDQLWVCESLSKFGLIVQGSQSLPVLELSENTAFSVAPYEFYFEIDQPAQVDAEPAADMEVETPKNLPAIQTPRIAPKNEQEAYTENTFAGGNREATVAGGVTLVPYIRISHPNTADDEILKLEGQLWVAGRDPGCEITIDSPQISRRHFELARTKEGFFVTDLGSSNGTKINGERIPAHEPTRIESGDEIRVMNVEMHFEIRDLQFNNRVESLPVASFDPMLAAPPMAYAPAWPEPQGYSANADAGLPEHWTQMRPKHLKQVDWKKNKVRLALFALVPLLLIMALTEPSKPKPEKDPSKDDTKSVSYEKLTKEQQSLVKDTFKLATNLYVQGKYALCLTELAKLHEMIPQYENSKELQSYCEQGLELVRRQEDLDRKERERVQIENQISAIVDGCKTKLNANATVDDTRVCLTEAMVLSPEHPLVIELINTAQMREKERKFLADQKKQTDNLAALGDAHFQRAMATYKQGRLAASIVEFKKFINAEYPRDDKNKSEAKRMIATASKELKAKVGQFLNKCRTLGEKNLFKDAWSACNDALSEDPKNEEVRNLRESMHNKLRKEMKALYEDSVLEESLGNVDSAKEKWKKILSDNLAFDDYTKKAKSKLEKYEGH